MSLFYKMLLCVAIVAACVLGYDLFQAEVAGSGRVPRIRYDSASDTFTFRRPDVDIRIVYASMFGPGEPVMRVRNDWIGRFEEEYSDLLARKRGYTIGPEDKKQFVDRTLRRAGKIASKARSRLTTIDAEEEVGKRGQQVQALIDWLEAREVFLIPLPPKATDEDRLKALRGLVSGLGALTEDAAARKVEVRPRLVTVERRWQGRWVLSANRPRFLTGREVPDVITGSKMELLALVQDGYAVPMNEPLPGQEVSPLDGPDIWSGREHWRDAFIPAMLEQGKYDFLDDPKIIGKIYLPPLCCSTYCIFYNEVLFRKAGIARPPRTWPEFIEVCEKLKAAGITPLTADADVYANMWQTALTLRAAGPELWEQTIAGVPDSNAPGGRRSSPPWTAEVHKQIYGAIRHIRANGYFDKDFRGSTWPAAQRGYAKGSAAMMISGSWLVQELSGYKDRASSEHFKLNCFTFPRWPGGREIDQNAVWASPYGMM
ncbi:MAG: ABC transporter substrate-binding protein, partial [Planctomycetota bacterium]